MFVYIHLHTVKILDIRVIAISYDLHVPLNTLLKYSLQLLVYSLHERSGHRSVSFFYHYGRF